MAVIAPQNETQTEQTADRRIDRPVPAGPTGQTGPQGLFACLDAAEIVLDAIDPACCRSRAQPGCSAG